MDGDGEFLSGAGFTFDVWPFAEGDPEEIYDGGSYDQATADGVVCIDGEALGTYNITESTVPTGYDGDDESKQVVVGSASTCADRLAADPDAYDATFVNTPLSEIEVIFRSLVTGATKATITCWAPDEYPDGDPMIFDSGTADEDETFTNLLLGLYICEIDIDP